MLTDDDAFDRWFVYVSADSFPTRAITTAEVLDGHSRGIFTDRTVVHHRFDGRRQSITLQDLVARSCAKK